MDHASMCLYSWLYRAVTSMCQPRIMSRVFVIFFVWKYIKIIYYFILKKLYLILKLFKIIKKIKFLKNIFSTVLSLTRVNCRMVHDMKLLLWTPYLFIYIAHWEMFCHEKWERLLSLFCPVLFDKRWIHTRIKCLEVLGKQKYISLSLEFLFVCASFVDAT